MARLHPMLETFTPTTSEPWNRVKAAHLLNRTTFGATPEDIDRAVEEGPLKTIDRLLDFPDACADELSKTDVPDMSEVQGYPKTFAERQKLFNGKTAEERMELVQQMNQSNKEALRVTMEWWLKRMMNGSYPLHEKLTFFWHGHFTTSSRDERSAWLMWQQNETWRRLSAGNFSSFVKAVARDPAMLDFLNNQQNRKKHPNENFARELMELFTLGIGNYTENDIKESARAFTGWGHDGESFIFRRYDHDNDDKQFMGMRGNFDGDDVIEIILRNKACAPYICSRLWKYFVNDNPDPQMMISLGDLLRDNKWEIRPVLRTLFTCKAFYQSDNIGAQIKCPVQLVIGTAKSLGVELKDYQRLHNSLDQMGQVPLAPPNVKGWPGGRVWINTSTIFVRYNTCLWIAGGTPLKTGRLLVDSRKRKGGQQVEVDTDGSPKEIVDHWIDRLIQRPIAEERREVLIDAIGRNPTEASVRQMVSLILSMPEYQLC